MKKAIVLLLLVALVCCDFQGEAINIPPDYQYQEGEAIDIPPDF